MVKIRLKRFGDKKNAIYRIIVINSAAKREGRPIEQVGFYNPKTKELRLDKTKATEWLKKGAQPTDTVKYLIDNSDENGNLIKKEKEGQAKLSKKAKAKAEAEKQNSESAA